MKRKLLHTLAVVGTLALTAVVAVVAVTRSDRPAAAPSSSPSASASPSASGSPGLAGVGPYIVFARADGSVFAYDEATGTTSPLGPIDGAAVTLGSAPRQPGSGGVVAFATARGTVWTVSRTGLTKTATIPAKAASGFEGGVVSTDDQRLALAAVSPEPVLIVVDLSGGDPVRITRTRRGTFPTSPLVPVAWTLGGSLVYVVPVCHCAGGAKGLYTFDLAASSSSLVAGAKSDDFFGAGITPDAQSVLYTKAGSAACPGNPSAKCPAPPYELRRLRAGHRGAQVLRRVNDAPFVQVVVSNDGRRAVVQRRDPSTGRLFLELVTISTGAPIRSLSLDGVPDGASPVAFLAGDVLIATVVRGSEQSLVADRDGRLTTIASTTVGKEPPVTFLGWLR